MSNLTIEVKNDAMLGRTNDKTLHIILIEQQKEIERLTELCNKYEEEHKTTFETWKKDIKENELLHSTIKEVREYIEHENFKRNVLVGVSTKKYTRDILNKLLEILDKVGAE